MIIRINMSDEFEKNESPDREVEGLDSSGLLGKAVDMLGDLTSAEIIDETEKEAGLSELSDSVNDQFLHDSFGDQSFEVLKMNYEVDVQSPNFDKKVGVIKVKPSHHLFLSKVVLSKPERYKANIGDYKKVVELANNPEFTQLYYDYEDGLKQVVREGGDSEDIVEEYKKFQDFLSKNGLEDVSVYDLYSDVQDTKSLVLKADRILNDQMEGEENLVLIDKWKSVSQKAFEMKKSGQFSSDQEYIDYLNSQTNLIVEEYGSEELKAEWDSISNDADSINDFLDENEEYFRSIGISLFNEKGSEESSEQVVDEDSLNEEYGKNDLDVFGESEIKDGRIDVKVDKNYSFSVKIFGAGENRTYFVEDKNGYRGPFKSDELNDRIDDGIAYDGLTKPLKSSSRYSRVIDEIPYSELAKLAKSVVGKGEERNFKIEGINKSRIDLFSKLLMDKGRSLEKTVKIANDNLTTEDSKKRLRAILISGEPYEAIKDNVDKLLWNTS